MRSVSSCRRLAAAVLIVTLLVPASFASEAPGTADSSLWAEFMAWLDSRFDIPNSMTADADSFTVWLMSRFVIPNG